MYHSVALRCSNQEQVLGQVNGGLSYWNNECHSAKVQLFYLQEICGDFDFSFRHGDHYQWQKVTSCIHNLLGGQRWVDLYGEMIINNKDKCTCKLTFVKVMPRPLPAPVIMTCQI